MTPQFLVRHTHTPRQKVCVAILLLIAYMAGFATALALTIGSWNG